MNHLSTAEVIAMLGAAQEELALRFNVAGKGGPGPQPPPAPAAVAKARRPDPPELDLLQDSLSNQFFYSVCGQPAHCGCRYTIVDATRWAEADMKKRPEIEARVLYLYGLDAQNAGAEESRAKLQQYIGRYEPASIKVVRSYAFLTFPSHGAAAAAQRLLCTKGYSVSFNRVLQPEEQAAAKKSRRARRNRHRNGGEEN
jgi:hypothetical protein